MAASSVIPYGLRLHCKFLSSYSECQVTSIFFIPSIRRKNSELGVSHLNLSSKLSENRNLREKKNGQVEDLFAGCFFVCLFWFYHTENLKSYELSW